MSLVSSQVLPMNLRQALDAFLPLIEEELQACVVPTQDGAPAYFGMMQYHMGWKDEHFDPVVATTPLSPRRAQGGKQGTTVGKRIRPLLTLLACQAAGGEARQALPACAAVEIIHNFSLVHDDIEDRSDTRRGRRTVWSRWGEAQAINVGDGMFALAHLALHRMPDFGVPPERVAPALRLLDETCLALCQGQHLDIAFENVHDVDVDGYVRMIAGKTAALMGCAAQLGALVATTEWQTLERYRRIGLALGLAFQMQDDVLDLIGKEFAEKKGGRGQDITEGKRTLMVIHTLKIASNADKGRLIQILKMHTSDKALRNEAVFIMQKYNAIEYVRQMSAQIVEESWKEAERLLQASEAKEKLKAFAEFLIKRSN